MVIIFWSGAIPCFGSDEIPVFTLSTGDKVRITESNDITGVIFHVLKGCHPYDIESLTSEAKLRASGRKFLKIETDYVKEDSQNILTRLEAFAQTLA